MARQACGWVAEYWDEHVACWLAGEDPTDSDIQTWQASYHGPSEDVAFAGFPEPYMGDLIGKKSTPRLVVLALHPGQFYENFQSRYGTFANEIREYGSYSNWTTTAPYMRAPWNTEIGPNRFHRNRLTFGRRWLDEPAATPNDLLVFEAYPWHLTTLNAPLLPPIPVIKKFVWDPIGELPVEDVFAFGRVWADVATALGLRLVDKLGAGGTPYGSSVASRAVRVFTLPSGQRVIVEWHQGGEGPPSAPEVELLKTALVSHRTAGMN